MSVLTALAASVVVLTNLGYTVGYDVGRRCPAWVAYDLEPSEVVPAKRLPVAFAPDSRVPETHGVQRFYDVMGDVYDRGHLAPAADFNFDTNALRQTYLFTNVAPMHRNLNRGAWSQAEREVRQLAASGTVHVVNFPLHIGDNAFVVPTHFVKVAYGWFGVRYWCLPNR